MNSVTLSSGAKSFVLMQSENVFSGVLTSRPTATTADRSSATPGARTPQGLPDLGVCGHEKTRFRVAPPCEPLAAVGDNLAVRDVVDPLTEVPDISLLVLSVIVERVLNELAILVLLDVDDCDRDFRDAERSLKDPRLDAYFRPSKKPSLGPFEDGDGNRCEGNERMINLR